MDMEKEVYNILSTVVTSVLASSVISTVINLLVTGHRNNRNLRKDLIAKAGASVLKRVELCYRIRRRGPDEDIDIKNMIHDIQEENSYYESLLLIESEWFGNRYSLYLNAVKRLTKRPIRNAWSTKGAPSKKIEKRYMVNDAELRKISRQFSKDSRLFLFAPTRVWMSLKDRVRKAKVYGN